MRRKHLLAVSVLIAALAGSAVRVTARDDAGRETSAASPDSAAAEVATVVIPGESTTVAGDASIPGPLEEAPRDEVAAASNPAVYQLGDGPTEVTAGGSWVSLRRCSIGVPPSDVERQPCDGPDGWAYVTGSVDTTGVHYGTLGSTDDLVVSALDDRLFVASAAPLSQDPSSAPPVWLIDSVTGQRGELTWRHEPTRLNAPDQVLVLFPAPKPSPGESGKPFLPRVVDRRDWTVRPLSVPGDATARLAIHQAGSGRIWIGTAPVGGHVGLAYSDDGGVSWTDVELPSSLRPTSAELEDTRGPDQLLVVAATADHVAVTNEWGGATDVFTSAGAGESWDTVDLDPAYGNGRRLYALADGRLMVVLSHVINVSNAVGVLVSSSPADWSQLDASAFDSDPEALAFLHTSVDVTQHGVVVHHERDSCADVQLGMPLRFSTDLTEWWMIPGLELEPHTHC